MTRKTTTPLNPALTRASFTPTELIYGSAINNPGKSLGISNLKISNRR